jgi:hypothetical protein
VLDRYKQVHNNDSLKAAQAGHMFALEKAMKPSSSHPILKRKKNLMKSMGEEELENNIPLLKHKKP